MNEKDVSLIVTVGCFFGIFLIIAFCGIKQAEPAEYVESHSWYGISISSDAIGEIESGRNPHAYNARTKATGLYQITPICLKDYNQYHDTQYSMDEMFNEEKNTTVYDWYMFKRIPELLEYYGISDSVENRLIVYNSGITCAIKGIIPKETKEYIKKYNKLTGVN